MSRHAECRWDTDNWEELTIRIDKDKVAISCCNFVFETTPREWISSGRAKQRSPGWLNLQRLR
jgi:hypothetical protein